MVSCRKLVFVRRRTRRIFNEKAWMLWWHGRVMILRWQAVACELYIVSFGALVILERTARQPRSVL